MMKAIVLFFLVIAAGKSFAQSLTVTALQCEYLSQPLGVQATHPKLSWKLVSVKRGVLQTAYRIMVADNLTSLKKGVGNVWDSKKVASDASIQIAYEGRALEPTKTYYWKVMAWDNQHEASMWSASSQWQMGLLNKWDWRGAKWIGYEAMPDSMRRRTNNSEFVRTPIKDVLPLIRKNFFVKKSFFRCRLDQLR